MQAMNSQRMLNVTTQQQAKSTEKLFSGYRILWDDPVGVIPLDYAGREIPFPRWQQCVDEFLEEKDVDEIKEMQSIMDEIYLGMPDEYYAYFDTNARDRITAAESGFVISRDD